jgi:hypothetical protein
MSDRLDTLKKQVEEQKIKYSKELESKSRKLSELVVE